MEMNQLKDIRLQQYLMNKKLQKMYSPMADTDGDGFVNMMDCYPFDKNRHGVWGWIKKRFTPKEKDLVVSTTPVSAPTITGRDGGVITGRDDVYTPPQRGDTTTTTYPSGRGRSSAPPTVVITPAPAPTPSVPISTETFAEVTRPDKFKTGREIVEKSQQVPLGEPPAPRDERGWLKKTWETGKDVLAGQTAFAGTGLGVWGSFGDRPTGLTAEQIQQRKRETTSKAFGGISIVGFGNGIIGLGSPLVSPFDKFTMGSTQQAIDIRREGRETKSVQEQQAQAIEQTAKNIDDLYSVSETGLTKSELASELFNIPPPQPNPFAPQSFSIDYKKAKEGSYTNQVKKFNTDADRLEKDVLIYERNVKNFNEKYEGKELSKSEYNKAIKEQNSLEKQRMNLEGKRNTLLTTEGILQQRGEQLKSNVSQELSKLRSQGIETELDEKTGEIKFKSEALDKKIAPVGFKLLGSYKGQKYGSLKSATLIGTQVAQKSGEAFVTGYTLGAVGVLPKIGGFIAKGGKVARVGATVGFSALAVGGVGAQTYTGYKYGKQFGVGGLGALTGGLTSTGQVAGFVGGGYAGSKAYFSRQVQKTLAGEYTRGVGERKGIIERMGFKYKGKQVAEFTGGKASQKGIYYTKVKGTPYKIRSGVKLKGQYFGQKGQSFVEVASKVTGGKAPKYYRTKGGLLESGKWAKARLYTQQIGTKGTPKWFKQDIFIKRSMLRSSKLFKLPKETGFAKSQIIRFRSDIRLYGDKVGVSQLPKKGKYFSLGEGAKFIKSAGQPAVISPPKWAKAPPTSTFFTKQLVMYKTPKGVKITQDGVTRYYSKQEFQSLFRTVGASNNIWKQLIAKGKLTFQDSNLRLVPLSKKAQISLTQQRSSSAKTSEVFDIGQQTTPRQILNAPTERALAVAQLQQIDVAGLVSSYSTTLNPLILGTSAGIVGTKNILESRNVLREQSKLRNIQQTRNLVDMRNILSPRSVIKTTQTTRITQVTRVRQVERPVPTRQTGITTVTPPINPIAWGGLFPLGLLGGGSGAKRRRSRNYTRALRRAYQPSVGAVVLGITSTKKPKMLTGLELRPVISKKGKRKGIKRKKANYLQNVNKILG